MCDRYTPLHQQWVESVFGAGAGPVAEAMHWGIEPNWRDGPSQLINARAEKLGESRFWRPLLEHGRCAIPADGFYEWRAVSTAVNAVVNDGPRLLAAVPPDDESESLF